MEHTQQDAKKILMFAGTTFLVVLSFFTIIAGFYLVDVKNKNSENTISVNGKGEVKAVPDVATFSFSVQETAKTTEAAQKVVSEKTAKILDQLQELDIPEKDIQTDSYSIYPQYEYSRVPIARNPEIAVDGTRYYDGGDRKRVHVGFNVRQQINIELHDFDKVAAVLSMLGETGVQNLNGPHFEIDDSESLEQEARKKAIENAREQARILARDLGVTLGDIVSFNENGGYQPYYAKLESQAVMDSAEAGSAPILPTGENTISSRVNIIYSIR